MYSQDSIDLLQNSGLQFKKHEEEGIDTLYFAELLMTSGLVLCENVKWLSFHRLGHGGVLILFMSPSHLKLNSIKTDILLDAVGTTLATW